jgi:hypothetical protein
VFHLLTDELVEELHSDDWSYYQELVEEIEYEIARELNYERQFDIDNAQEMRYDNDVF